MSSVRKALGPAFTAACRSTTPCPMSMPPCASARLASATVLKCIPKFNASDPEAGQTTVVGLDAGWRGRVRGGDCVHSGDSASAIFLRHEAERGYRSRATSMARSRCTGRASRTGFFLAAPAIGTAAGLLAFALAHRRTRRGGCSG
jgi:hypothetical protein